MNIEISKKTAQQLNWYLETLSGEEYSGSYNLNDNCIPSDIIQWDQNPPDNWEEIEEAIEEAITNYLYINHPNNETQKNN